MKYKLEVTDDEDIQSIKEIEKLADSLGLDTHLLQSEDGFCWEDFND